jgi:hypothetical protein
MNATARYGLRNAHLHDLQGRRNVSSLHGRPRAGTLSLVRGKGLRGLRGIRDGS